MIRDPGDRDSYEPGRLSDLERDHGRKPVSSGSSAEADVRLEEEDAGRDPQWSYDSSTPKRDGGRAGSVRGSSRLKRSGPFAAVLVALAIGGSGMVLLSPGLLLVHLKEVMVDKFNDSLAAMDIRSEKIMTKRLASKTTRGLCSPVKLRCRYQTMSTRQVKKLERDGKVTINGDRRPLGRVKPDSITFTPDDGSGPRTITASNFKAELKANPAFRAAMWRGYNPKLAGFSDKVFGSFAKRLNITKEKSIKGSSSKEDMKAQLVDHTKGTAGAAVNAGVKKEADGTYKDENGAVITETEYTRRVDEAQKLEAKLKGNLQGLAGKATKATIKGTLTASAMGLGAVDSACTGYRLIRTVGFAAKVIGAYQLIRYAQVFMNAADSIKAGDADPEQVDYLASILTSQNSQGKSATDSYGYQYAAYGSAAGMPSNDNVAPGDAQSLTGDQADQVATNDEVLHYVNGQLVTKNVMSKIIGFVGNGGSTTRAADGVCKFVKSGWGQAIVIGAAIGGLIVGVLSGGTSIGLGEAAQAGVSVALGVAIALLTPKLTQMVAGNIITGDENGNQSGNAITSGMGAYNAQLSQSRGLAALTKPDAIEYQQMTRSTEVAYAQAEDLGRSPFDPTSRHTIAGMLVEAMMPLRSQLATVSSLVTAPLRLLQRAASTSPLARADVGQYDVCPDADYAQYNLAADPFCNVRFGLSPEALSTDPEVVLDYMLPYVDETTGQPKDADNDYGKWIENCVNRQTSIGGYTDDNSSDGQECIQGANGSEDQKYSMFRLFYLDQSIIDGMDNGLGEGDAAAPTSSTGGVTVASWNLLNSEIHPGDSRFIGQCPAKVSDSECTKLRAARQAKVIEGKSQTPQFDLVGTQETSPSQYRALLRELTGYEGVPSNQKDINRMQQTPQGVGGATSIIWNTSTFTKVGEGKVPAFSNVVIPLYNPGLTWGQLRNNGNILAPWVALRSNSTGQLFFVTSVHYPTPDFVYSPHDAGAGEPVRTRKAAAALTMRWVREKAAHGTVIVMGDFNETPTLRTVYCVYTTGGYLQNAHDMQAGSDPSQRCPDPSASGWDSVDQLYLTPSTGTSASQWTQPPTGSHGYQGASDHAPIWVRIGLTRQPS